MVSHDIKEVAYMADRIVVLSANPGRIRTVIENRLPRPRDLRSPEFLRLVDQLHDVITSTELPDVVVSTVAASVADDTIEPLPRAQGQRHRRARRPPRRARRQRGPVPARHAAPRRPSTAWCAWSRPRRCSTSSTRHAGWSC